MAGASIVLSLLLLITTTPATAAPPPVRDLRIQKVGETTYFHVRFEAPADLRLPGIEPGPYNEAKRRRLGYIPQLAPQDGRTFAVYPRVALPHFRPDVRVTGDGGTKAPLEGLEFVGKVRDAGKAEFLLLYPNGEEPAGPSLHLWMKPSPGLARFLHRATWATAVVELDFSKAASTPPINGSRGTDEPMSPDDLERLWAEGQAVRFAVLEAQVTDFGFYGFACAATGRKYGVRDPVLEGERRKDPGQVHRRLYETTTGASAIAESLATQRLLNADSRDPGPRSVDIARVPGITIAEHPWKKMMAGKTPSPEPLARLAPHDNYYLHFKDIRKLLEFGELLEEWGASVLQGYELTSRDYRVRQRYERQLCLRSTAAAKTLGPALIKSLAVTGNDPFVREGSDITVIFHVVNRPLFLAAVEGFINEARKEFGRELAESKSEYDGVTIESFVTPLREVSLHRAALDEFVIYSNSPAGLRRVIDTHKGSRPALVDSLDFQYMRTVFDIRDKDEDGFAFLSDAFIRQLVGPASKIKEKRRLEALTSMRMLTHGAMFAAWETGRLPRSHEQLLEASRLKSEHIYVPEGKRIAWDAKRQVAVSDVHNTFHFATPLVELPIDKITPLEERQYREFRDEYQKLWRQFFDPVGMRFSLSDKQIKAEVYILPMVNNTHYQSLRSWTGGGTTELNPARFLPRTLLQFTGHVSGPTNDGIGDSFTVFLDDSADCEKLVEYWVHKQLEPKRTDWKDELRTVFQLPLTAGVSVANQQEFNKSLEQLRGLADGYVGPTTDLRPAYKGVVIKKTVTKPGLFADELLNDKRPEKILPTLYHALIGDMWYVSLREETIRDLIDQWVARRDGKGPPATATVPINASLYLAPEAMFKARPALHSFLEWEAHRRALANNAVWHALVRCGLAGDEQQGTFALSPLADTAALQFLGFVPVSPDGSAYTHLDAANLVNRRHGSLSRPTLHPTMPEDSPLIRLLDQARTLRVDLRFREDGFHSVLTIDRAPARAR